MGYVLGAVIGVAAGVACVVALGGVAGIVAGLAAAALLYLGVGQLLKPERKLGGVIASMLPDGEAATRRIDEARDLMHAVSARRERISDAAVLREIDDLLRDIEALVACVEAQPSTYRRLAHFLSTYRDQCVRMLDGYLGVERLSTPELVAGAREDAIEGLCALSGAAQGELARATGAKATEVEASSEAIQRLIEMDGYAPDAPADAAAAPAAGDPARGKGRR
ncbi:hypothetical protein [Collinsella intestinalis]|uniref:hypothetical protein n=1 Tax=Collinsella intestinalis TaxID=147207 RepID=UPI0025A353CB|nr:hypothetical protein [Collinsella intestinalis]MDM8162799.1 hypothetical protein [Collinsella intestinalis]